MNKIKLDKGITLVALIITIIILLILAVVAIAAVNNEGIIRHAQNATGMYNVEKSKEENVISGYEDFIEESLYGKENTETGPTKITISGPSTAFVGEEVKFEAMDQDGKTLYSDDIIWSKDLSAGAITQNSNNSISFVSESYTGIIQIKATSRYDESVYAVHNIEITKAGPTKITISGPSVALVGQEVKLEAIDQDGKTIYSDDIIWSKDLSVGVITQNSNNSISFVSESASFTGIIQIKARSRYDESVYAVHNIEIGNAITGIEISGPGSNNKTGMQIPLTVCDQQGNRINARDIVWTVPQNGVSLYVGSTNIVYLTSTFSGSIEVKATYKFDESIKTVYYINIRPDGPTEIEIVGPSGAIQKGERTYLAVYDQNNDPLYEDDIYWSIPSGVTIENTSGGVYITSTITGSIYISATSRKDSSVSGGIYISVTN